MTLKEKRNMMYNNKLVAVVKVDGKILRENSDIVYIPFGAEYSISFKNLHSADAVVDVTIDGEDVLGDSSLIIRSGEGGSIEGFMKDNRVSHKFKFIEKTSQISDYRGDNISDGMIRIAFKYAKPAINNGWITRTYPDFDFGRNVYGSSGNTDHLRSMGTLNSLKSTYSSQPDYSSVQISANVNDDGITVKGGASNQSFVTTTIGDLEAQEHVIVFQLKGETRKGKIEQPILIKTKIKCDTCGTNSQLRTKFCGNCGTSLVE
jgi:hypothetical protein